MSPLIDVIARTVAGRVAITNQETAMKYAMQELSGTEILFVGHDPQKLEIGRARLETAGRSFFAVFSSDLLQTDYTAGRFGVVIVCDSVPESDCETICLNLARERPGLPVIVMPRTDLALERAS